MNLNETTRYKSKAMCKFIFLVVRQNYGTVINDKRSIILKWRWPQNGQHFIGGRHCHTDLRKLDRCRMVGFEMLYV